MSLRSKRRRRPSARRKEAEEAGGRAQACPAPVGVDAVVVGAREDDREVRGAGDGRLEQRDGGEREAAERGGVLHGAAGEAEHLELGVRACDTDLQPSGSRVRMLQDNNKNGQSGAEPSPGTRRLCRGSSRGLPTR